MTSGIISGIVTLLLLVLFIGIVIWAWSDRRKADFERAARLPLDHPESSDDSREGGDRK